MAELTICMPSNRKLADARAAIDSAVAFCKARDALLVISDNSRDPEKRDYLQAIGAPLVYIESPDASAADNFRICLEAVTTPFLMPMGDDDLLTLIEGATPVDLSELPFDYVGVAPVTHVYSQRAKIGRKKSFEIAGEDPEQRIVDYLQQSDGDNATFYSVFRRDAFLSIYFLFLDWHPTKGAYCDWALMLALLAEGKMGFDPSYEYRYEIERWDTDERVGDAISASYVSAGLPADSAKYEKLFMFLDVFVLALRTGSPLPPQQRQRLGKNLVIILLNNFVLKVANEAENYDGTIRHLASMILDEQDSFTQFQLGLLIADRVKPGLKDAYVSFAKQALSEN